MEPMLDGDYAFNPSLLIADLDSDASFEAEESKNKGRNLRRVSRSSPHLDIPHYIPADERGFNALHNALTGFFEREHHFPTGLNSLHRSPADDTACPTPTALAHVEEQKLPTLTSRLNAMSLPPIQYNQHSFSDLPSAVEPSRKPSLTISDRNKSAVELSNADQSFIGGLRKVASIANYDLVHRDQEHSSDHSSSSLSVPRFAIPQARSHHYISPPNTQHHPIDTIHEDPSDQGLMMTVRSFAGGLSSGASSGSSSLGASASQGLHNAGDSNTTQLGATSPPKSTLGSVMGMFGRGFFAKPVIRSEEENYRYIMALDR